MSIAIDVDTVTAVLLADGWHDVANASFGLDAYEFLWSGHHDMTVAQLEAAEPQSHWDSSEPLLVHGGGQSGVCATGFAFMLASGERMAGPLTAILAVKYRP